jgi:hypothetical protein
VNNPSVKYLKSAIILDAVSSVTLRIQLNDYDNKCTPPANQIRQAEDIIPDYHQESIPAALRDRLESFDSAHAVGWLHENKLSTHHPKKSFSFTVDGVTGRILIYFLQVAPPEVHSAVQSTESDCHSGCHAPFVDRPK